MSETLPTPFPHPFRLFCIADRRPPGHRRLSLRGGSASAAFEEMLSGESSCGRDIMADAQKSAQRKSPAEAGLGGRRTEIGHRRSAFESVPHAPPDNNQKLKSGGR
jgi:hypothetical protein